MAESERSEVLAFLQAFNNLQVKYLVVGGYAVNHYGYKLLINKEKTGRTKDKDDFEQLSKISP